MNKSIKVILSILAIILISGLVFWSVKNRKQKAVNNQGVLQNQNVDQSNKPEGQNENSEEIDTSDWKTYRNEKYEFEIKYPKDWKSEVKDDSMTGDNNKEFFLKKDGYTYFAILPTGGFGQGIIEPIITYEKFKGKDAKMFSYKEYPYPSFIYIISDLPKKWGVENRIELRGSGENIKILQEMYDDFNFIK